MKKHTPRERPCLAVTAGDCAGVGPELVLHALNSRELAADSRLAVYGSREILSRVSRLSGIPFKAPAVYPSLKEVPESFEGHVLIDDGSAAEFSDEIEPGRAQATCGRASAEWVRRAAGDVLQGRAQALVTAPISKEAVAMAGVCFPGHTEMLADICGASEPCMAFFSPRMIISLATIHTALTNVPALLDRHKLVRIAELTREACIRSGIRSPRIGMLALNPHGGENGMFGFEEREVIIPAIEDALARGIDVRGPLVPDTAFTWLGTPASTPPCDAWIAMYHDQALIPFKMVAFADGVNATLGLPIIRTSPDHGTAFDIAWQGKASPESFFAAAKLAVRFVASDESPQNLECGT